ncbi:hypothetical protein GE061_019056 [Apolygus lucorum]|uniref:Uncharacterized protein n=1 Tax=Apolygus lucorum TaxID=248454 RepID=A0A8S9X7D7_APOLU|nr:hypothetical protein GE061_019056 [Apolygus lucorum]
MHKVRARLECRSFLLERNSVSQCNNQVMGKKKEVIKEPVVPVQDRRICGGICLCQFTIVISCVSLVYLAVAVYMPSYRAFTYGMETKPVMCQAVNTVMAKNCDWASCGEWCLTKTSGFCPQIHVTTRQNGTSITLEKCERLLNFSCPMVLERSETTPAGGGDDDKSRTTEKLVISSFEGFYEVKRKIRQSKELIINY